MKRIIVVLIGLTSLIAGNNARAQTPASFRVLFGVTDTSSTRWDGSVTVTPASRCTLEGWRFSGTDSIHGYSFVVSTRTSPRLNGTPGIVANGIIISAAAVSDNSVFSFTTAQGNFSFTASEIPYAAGIYKFGGAVYVDRTPVTQRLTNTPEEEDYPSLAAASNGDIWLAYVQFHHSPDHLQLRVSPHQAPTDFSAYREPTGGDQIWVRKYSGGTWGEPMAITKPGGDLYRTAIAVEGKGRAWVFWSRQHEGNFDIFARAVDDSGPQEGVQISKEFGNDIDPVATTDASGRVWVAWQGWRDGRAAIFAAHQDGGGFSALPWFRTPTRTNGIPP
jgi:hypothetical protein